MKRRLVKSCCLGNRLVSLKLATVIILKYILQFFKQKGVLHSQIKSILVFYNHNFFMQIYSRYSENYCYYIEFLHKKNLG